MSFKKLSSVVLATILVGIMVAGTLTACSSDPETPETPVTVTLSADNLNLIRYEDATLTASVAGSSDAVRWSVSDSAVVSLESEGNTCTILAVGEGNADISASVGEISASCAVSVTDDGVIPQLLCNLPIGKDSDYAFSLLEGDTYDIMTSLTFNGMEYSDYSVSFEAEELGIVSVSETGRVTALSAGTEQITVMAKWHGADSPALIKSVRVTVPTGLLSLDSYNVDLTYDCFKTDGGAEKSFDLSEITANAIHGGTISDNVDVTWSAAPQAGDNTDLFSLAGTTLSTKGGAEGTMHYVATYASGNVEIKSAPVTVNASITRGSVVSDRTWYRLSLGSLNTVSGISYSGEASKTALAALSVYDDKGEAVILQDGELEYVSSDTSVFTVSDGKVVAQSSSLDVGESASAELGVNLRGLYYTVAFVTVSNHDGYTVLTGKDDLSSVNASGNYVLMNDIDLEGRAGSLVSGFSGIFDGNGYALKNGELNHSSTSKDNYAFFSGTTSGTIRNIAFLGWKMISTDGTTADNWSQMGIIGLIDGSAVVENIYVEATVSVNGGANKQSKGVLIGNADKGMVRNCIVNVSYTGDYTEFGTMFGATWAKVWENCYAIVSGIDANSVYGSVSNHSDYTNYASLAELKEAQSAAFADGGVFTSTFWIEHLGKS